MVNDWPKHIENSDLDPMDPLDWPSSILHINAYTDGYNEPCETCIVRSMCKLMSDDSWQGDGWEDVCPERVDVLRNYLAKGV